MNKTDVKDEKTLKLLENILKSSDNFERNLPTKQDYHNKVMEEYQLDTDWSSKPFYKCPKCGEGMYRNMQNEYRSYPTKYDYKCLKCGFKEQEV
jgi:predicted RNA-binding Zn-ribbon protein involved in translation (DUF1610 family)